MTIDKIIMALTFLSSAIALYFAIRKQEHDIDNSDADTIASLFQTVRDLQKDNKDMQKEFEEYKRHTTEQLSDMASEIVQYRKWANRLVSQLEQAGIVPVRFE